MRLPCFGRSMFEALWYAVGVCLIAALAVVVATA
jgi:hypothetical protein